MHQRRHDSCPRVKGSKFWQKNTGKTKQMTNWSVSTFKCKPKFFRFEIVKYENSSFQKKDWNKTNSYFVSLTANNHF